MSNLSKSQLYKLYIDFTIYRDAECNGRAKMSVEDFYNKNRDRYTDA